MLGQAEAQAYTRGRISAYLGQINATIDSGAVQRLESDIAVYQQLVPDLEEQLDAEAIEEKLTHSLGYLSGKMTAHARALKLEHGDGLVRLNPKKGERAMTTELVVSELVTNAIRYAEPPIRLTVVTDTPAGITELLRIGSTKNHAGYHLAAHLALHQYFAANSRPVPRFLMLDQPTQPYYPSGMAKRCGRLEDLGSFVWISRSLVRVCR